MALAASIFSLISFGGNVLESVGQIQEGETIAKIANLNAQVARGEADLIRGQTRLIDAQREVQRRSEVKNLDSFISTQIALFAKSGVLISGSPLDVIEESASNAELSIIFSDIDAEMKKLQIEQEAQDRDFEAGELEVSGRLARATGLRRAGSTLLSSAAELGLQFTGSGGDRGGGGSSRIGRKLLRPTIQS